MASISPATNAAAARTAIVAGETIAPTLSRARDATPEIARQGVPRRFDEDQVLDAGAAWPRPS
jgi:hypothetical protein